MTIRRVNESDEELAERFVEELDDNFLYCRGRRRHRYPVVIPRRGRTVKLPKGFSFEPIDGQLGMIRTFETCEICGRTCVTVITRDDFLSGRKVSRKYEDPPGYSAPHGTGKALQQGNLATRELERRLIEGGLFGMPE